MSSRTGPGSGANTFARYEVDLPHEPDRLPSAAQTLHSLLRDTARAFPQVFRDLDLPERPWPPGARREPAETLTRFEVLRGLSSQRMEIAHAVADAVQRTFVLTGGAHTIPLEEIFSGRAAALSTSERPADQLAANAGKRPPSGLLPFDELTGLIRRLERDGYMTPDAAYTAQAMLQRARTASDGDLVGERFLLLGGTAELSPLPYLLERGATVLTTHTSDESLARAVASDAGLVPAYGRLFAVDGGVDLLTQPAQLAECAVAFSKGRPVHVGAFAYRGRDRREWRLTAAMDGIVRRLREVGLLASVTYYLSPSVVTEVSPVTARKALDNLAREQTAAARLLRGLSGGRLYTPNVLVEGERFWARGFVPRQGISYMAGNLFGKNYAAEAYQTASLAGRPRVSANVAPITLTRSTDVPAARRALSALGPLGIELFEPVTARRLMFLLMMADLFDATEQVSPPSSKQVHGGVFTNAWSLESVTTRAYLQSFVPL